MLVIRRCFAFNVPMFNSSTLHIGLRYARAKRRHQFISFVSMFSFLGMALGTLALIVVLSVMNGFDKEIKERILTVVPHGFIDQLPATQDWEQLAEQATKHPRVLAAAPYISQFVMLSSRRSVMGVELQAILPEQEKGVSVVNQFMTQGYFDDLKPGEFGLILGGITARSLGVGLGDKVVMTLPEVSITPAGIFPRMKRFTVVGIFSVGAQVDQRLAMIHLNDAQRLLRRGDNVQGVRISVDDIYAAKPVIDTLAKQLGENYQTKDWSQTQGSLFQAIELEKRMVTLLLMIIIFVAALNIVTSLILMVADKRGDIAVLRTMGMTTGEIMGIFIIQGASVGFGGIILGGVLGCLLALNISNIITWFESTLGLYIFDPNVYFISNIPSDLRWGDVGLIAIVGFLLSIIATFYPAYRASKVEPAEVLRYE